MKRALSIVLTVIMLTSLLSLLAIPASAVPDGGTGKVLTMYVSDSGNDTNDGLSPSTPKQTINKAVDYMKKHVSSTSEYTSAEIVLVGNITISKSTITSDHPLFSLTIKSAEGTKHSLLLGNNFRIGGETLFTNIKILMTASAAGKGLIANGSKLTIGAPGVENDVITNEGGVSTYALGVIGGFPDWTFAASGIDVTLNCGEYSYISTGAYAYGSIVNGDVSFVINNGVKVNDGVISIGGGMQSKTAAMVDTGIKCSGNYNVVINGGTFTNTNIHIGALNSGSGGYRDHTVEGDTTIDINGGTFTNCKIATFETLGGVASKDLTEGKGVDFKKGITVDLVDIPSANKEAYAAMVEPTNISETLTKNKITVVKHKLISFTDVNDDQHKAFCPCGCDTNEMQDHTYDNGTVTVQPSHSRQGERTYTCSLCNGTKTEVINPSSTSHDYTTGWVSADDTNHKKTCDDPNCPDAEKGAITEAHQYGEPIVTNSTHTEEGKKEFECLVCGHKKTETVEKTPDHSYQAEFIYHDAEQHKRLCECGDARMSAHYWGAGKVTKQATAEEEGEMTYTCSDCGGTKTEAIAKLEAPESEPADEGCGSSVGVGIAAVAAAAVIGIAFVSGKKKN